MQPHVPESFRLTEELSRKLLSKALEKGGDFAEIFLEYKPQTRLTFDEGKLRNMIEGIEAGIGIRVLVGDQVGYAYSENMSEKAMLEAASIAGSIANGSRKVDPVAVAPRPADALFTVTDTPLGHQLTEKVDLLTRADKAARQHDNRVKEVQAGYQDFYRHIQIINSDGVWVQDDQHLTRLMVFATAADGNLRCSAYDVGGGRMNFSEYATQFSPESIGQEAARGAIVQLTADEAPSGQMPVVIAPGYGGTMVHEAVGHGFEGDFISRKTSVYTDRVGQKVAADGVTIIDDGTIPYLRGSYNIDDEGTSAARNVLVENGVLTGYMQDRISANLLDMARTGNARRESFRYPPMPRMTNTFIDKGDKDPEEIIGSVKKGLYAMKMGSGQVDITTGNFVFTVDEAALIEDGKLTRPVRGATLIGNGPESMNDVTMVGNDLKVISAGTCGKGQWVPVGDGMPTVKLSTITVGGTA